MGVHGLWRLIEPSGKPVPLETLENKVLAVDISIWLHQAIKGFQDAKGAAIPNAHLLGIYHRVCKLLYFKIKPVFVFDGGVPALKKQTIAKRNQLKSRNTSEADRLQKQLLSTLLKHTAISKVLSEKTKASIAAQTKKSAKNKDELYALPSSSELDSTLSSSEEEFEDDSSDSTEPSPLKQYDLHSIDTKSPYFQSLPIETRHEILTELKETRKQNSWGRLHELPKKSDDFSSYQMKRLLKRQQVQAALDDTAKEMGGNSLSLSELESLLHDRGIPTSNEVGQRIASDSNTRFLYIKDIKEALEKAKIDEEKKKEQSEEPKPVKTKADLEEEEELQRAIALSLEAEPSSCSNSEENKTEQEFSFLENFRDEDFKTDSSEGEFEEIPIKEKFSSAQSYMMEYSGLTPAEISKIISQNARKNTKKRVNLGNLLPRGIARTATGKSGSINSKNLEQINEDVEVECDSTTEIDRKDFGNSKKILKFTNQTDNSENNDEVTKNINIESQKTEIAHNRVEIDSDTIEIVENRTTTTNDNIESTTSPTDKVLNEKDKNVFKTSKPDTDKKESSVENESLNIENDTVEFMSDTESSSSEDFLIVEDFRDADNKKNEKIANKDQVKLLIVPEKTDDDDKDLFSDIFKDKKDFEKLDEILNKVQVNNEEKTQQQAKKSEPDNVVAAFVKNKTTTDKREPEEDSTIINSVEKAKITTINEPEFVKSKEESKVLETPKESAQEIEECKIETANSKNIPSDETINTTKNEEDSFKFKTPDRTEPKLSLSQLQELKDNLQREKIDLIVEKSTKERLATNISDQMYQEAQELLQLFGVPYVIAPMEAEAQCAFLDEIELTDGTITDDSDIWLFGGRTVYKNFFDQAKYVMEFKAENIKHHFKLSRPQMILLALLVGSDYTIGVRGIGPVTALEILSTFPPPEASEFDVTQAQLISGLKEFKSWFTKGQSGGPGRSALKNKLKNITFTENFPNVQVVQAYMEPKVETSRETFSWCKPDFVALTLFAREKFGWSSRKTDEILNPVIKRVEESRIQKSIKAYFKTKFRLDGDDAAIERMSKRVKLAIERFGKTQEELIAEEMELLEKERQKKLKKTSQVVEGEPRKKRSKKDKAELQDQTEKNNQDDDVTSSVEKPEEKKRVGRKKSQDKNSLKPEESRSRNERKKKVSDTSDNLAVDQPKKSRKKQDAANYSSESDQKSLQTKKKPQTLIKEVESLSEKPKGDPTEELRLYTNVALELRQRRARKNELLKMKKDEQVKQLKKDVPKKPVEVPKELEPDEEIQHLLATTSKSVQRVEEIHKEVQKELCENKTKISVSGLHNKEVIHQKLRDRSDLLRNKLKAIEVFRKSKKGPGYVPKRGRLKRAPKEDAGLSEDSDN